MPNGPFTLLPLTPMSARRARAQSAMASPHENMRPAAAAAPAAVLNAAPQNLPPGLATSEVSGARSHTPPASLTEVGRVGGVRRVRVPRASAVRARAAAAQAAHMQTVVQPQFVPQAHAARTVQQPCKLAARLLRLRTKLNNNRTRSQALLHELEEFNMLKVDATSADVITHTNAMTQHVATNSKQMARIEKLLCELGATIAAVGTTTLAEASARRELRAALNRLLPMLDRNDRMHDTLVELQVRMDSMASALEALGASEPVPGPVRAPVDTPADPEPMEESPVVSEDDEPGEVVDTDVATRPHPSLGLPEIPEVIAHKVGWCQRRPGDWCWMDLASYKAVEFPTGSSSNAASPSKVSAGFIRMPQPAKFSGEGKDDMDDAMFAFENYLSGTGTPKQQWPIVAMPLLTGTALRTYTAFAQNARSPPTWEDFKGVMSTFARGDKRIAARRDLYAIKQTGTVAEYHHRFSVLLATVSDPKPTSTDLLLMFWTGLSPAAREHSPVDPLTGAFWVSLDSLVRHALAIEMSKVVTRTDRSPALGSATQHPRKSWTKLRSAHVQGKKQSGGILKQPSPKKVSFGKGAAGTSKAHAHRHAPPADEPYEYVGPVLDGPCTLPGHAGHTIRNCRTMQSLARQLPKQPK